ncbi:MAG: outer membrane beta-barrel protein [Oceanospirillaceae bacterium]|nr:outer membrane beta-barrel protein [Oceanospirillaceae bacterium]
MKKHLLSVMVAAGLASVAGNSLAYEAGDVVVRAGYASVEPDADPSSSLKGLDVDDGDALGITGTYMLSDNIGLGLLVATPFNHDITLDGVGKIGDTDQLPPTLTLQYVPQLNLGGFQPYAGIGVNYTNFFNEDLKGGGDLKLSDSWGVAGELGADVQIGQNWLLNAAVWYIDIDTDVKINGSKVGSVDVDPWVYMIGAGYRF